MKRRFLFFLLACVMLSLVACGDSDIAKNNLVTDVKIQSDKANTKTAADASGAEADTRADTAAHKSRAEAAAQTLRSEADAQATPYSNKTAQTTHIAAATAASHTTGFENNGPDPFKKYDPPIIMPVAYNGTATQYFPEGDDYDNNAWSRYLAEEAGIILKVLWISVRGDDEYRNMLNASLASGEIPAVFEGDYAMFRSCADAGLAADLTEIWGDWASAEMKREAAGYDRHFEASTVGGRLMAIPKLANSEQSGHLLWIRTDWLESVGLSAPETFEDVVEIARAFTDNDPDGNGADDTYGIGLRMDIFNTDFHNINGIMSAFGAPTRSGEQYFRHEGSGVIMNAGIMPEAKEALKLVNQLYHERVIDPGFTNKGVMNIEEDINNHKVGMGYGAEWNGWYPYAGIYRNDGVIYKPYAPPPAHGKKLRIGTPFQLPWYNIVDGAYDHPEAIIVAGNFTYRLLNRDTPDNIRAVYGDMELWRLMPWRFAAPAEFDMQRYFELAYKNNNDEELVPNEYKPVFRQIMSFIDDGNPSAQGIWSQRGPGGAISIITNGLIPAGTYYISPILGERPNSYVALMTSLNRKMEQAYIEIITGPPGDADSVFDEFADSWMKAGGEQILGELNAMYPK